MSWLVPILLFLHAFAAIVAFGPVYVLPLIGAMSGKEPMHGNYSLRLSELIEMRRVIPFALTMPVTGVLMIWAAHFDLAKTLWLNVAIVLYVVAIGFALMAQVPTVRRMIELTSQPPAALGAGGLPAGGPPPEFLALVKRSQQGGLLLAVLVAVIAFLMVTKLNF